VVMQVQYPQASFATGDTDVATKSPTAHTADRYVLYKNFIRLIKILANFVERHFRWTTTEHRLFLTDSWLIQDFRSLLQLDYRGIDKIKIKSKIFTRL